MFFKYFLALRLLRKGGKKNLISDHADLYEDPTDELSPKPIVRIKLVIQILNKSLHSIFYSSLL